MNTFTISLDRNDRIVAVRINGKDARRTSVPSKKGQFFEIGETVGKIGTVRQEHKGQFLQINPPCFNDFEDGVWC